MQESCVSVTTELLLLHLLLTIFLLLLLTLLSRIVIRRYMSNGESELSSAVTATVDSLDPRADSSRSSNA